MLSHRLEADNSVITSELKSARRKAADNARALSNMFHSVGTARNTIAGKDEELASLTSQLEEMRRAMMAAAARAEACATLHVRCLFAWFSPGSCRLAQASGRVTQVLTRTTLVRLCISQPVFDMQTALPRLATVCL